MNVHSKYTRLFSSVVLIMVFFCIYYAGLNYIQMKIESHQSTPKEFIGRESAVKLAEIFIKEVGSIPKENNIWIHDVMVLQDNANITNYGVVSSSDTNQTELFPWKRIFGLQYKDASSSQKGKLYWSVQIADGYQSKGGFTISVSTETGEIIGLSRYGWHPPFNDIVEITKIDQENIIADFLRHTEYSKYFQSNKSIITDEDNCTIWQSYIDNLENETLQREVFVRVCGNEVIEYKSNIVNIEDEDVVSFAYIVFKIFFLGVLPIVLLLVKSFVGTFVMGFYIIWRWFKNRTLPLEWSKASMVGGVLFSMLFIKELIDRIGVWYYNLVFSDESIHLTSAEAITTFSNALENTIFGGVTFFVLPTLLFLVLGRHLSSRFFPKSMEAFDLFFSGKWKNPILFNATVRGIVVCLVLIVLEAIVIFVGGLINAWSDPRTPITIVTSPLHWFSSTIAYDGLLLPALNEEITFRLFLISILFSKFKKPFISVLLAAVIWAMAHITLIYHPFYLQTFALILNGIILGFVYIRYGLWETVVAHFLYNAIIFAIPIFTIATINESLAFVFISISPVLFFLLYFYFSKILSNRKSKLGGDVVQSD